MQVVRTMKAVAIGPDILPEAFQAMLAEGTRYHLKGALTWVSGGKTFETLFAEQLQPRCNVWQKQAMPDNNILEGG